MFVGIKETLLVPFVQTNLIGAKAFDVL